MNYGTKRSCQDYFNNFIHPLHTDEFCSVMRENMEYLLLFHEYQRPSSHSEDCATANIDTVAVSVES